MRAGPLLLVGLGVALSFRCGVWNIGGEGQLLAGALAATALATRALGDAPAALGLPLALGAGAAAGAGLGGDRRAAARAARRLGGAVDDPA